MRYFMETDNHRNQIGWVYKHESGFIETEREIELHAEHVSSNSEIVVKSTVKEITEEEYYAVLKENKMH